MCCNRCGLVAGLGCFVAFCSCVFAVFWLGCLLVICFLPEVCGFPVLLLFMLIAVWWFWWWFQWFGLVGFAFVSFGCWLWDYLVSRHVG